MLAHVDAGKTSLTERILFDAGAIHRLGSVDGGDTQTDTGEIERTAAASRSARPSPPSPSGDLRVNLIDTPGHADFVARGRAGARRARRAAILVISAVEGIQAQTRVLLKNAAQDAHAHAPVRQQDRQEGGARARHPRRAAGRPRQTTYGRAASSLCHSTRSSWPTTTTTPCWKRWSKGASSRPASCEGGSPSRPPPAGSIRSFHGSAIGGQGVAELLAGVRDLLPVPTPPGRRPAGHDLRHRARQVRPQGRLPAAVLR
ncbi:GTP-binding protein [Nonomuraea dietziae]|uniref:GTP-binding protein n=1 Tax=Nonomuraea dietziae TaxID=65515 RepID=UPI0031D29FB0